MSNDSKLFVDICELQQPLEVSLGDGHSPEARGRGDIHLAMKLSTGKSKNCTLHNVLYVPELSYNLFSVTRAAEAGMSTVFDTVGCAIQSASGEVVATATGVANLYKLACVSHRSQANTAINEPNATKELWHKRYGHLGVTNLDKLAMDNLVDGLTITCLINWSSVKRAWMGNTTGPSSQPVVVTAVVHFSDSFTVMCVEKWTLHH